MKAKEIFSTKPFRKIIYGSGIILGALVLGKIAYNYSMYSNLKYVRKQLENIKFDEEL